MISLQRAYPGADLPEKRIVLGVNESSFLSVEQPVVEGDGVKDVEKSAVCIRESVSPGNREGATG